MIIKADKSYIGIVPDGEVTLTSVDEDLTVNGIPLRKEINTYGRTVRVFMPITLGGLEIQTPIISIEASKNIKKTDLAAGNGSVKELININDYSLTISGIIIGENDYPVDEVQALTDLYNRNEALDISCALTELVFPVNTKVVITNLALPTVQGREHLQPFSMNLESDIEFSLFIE